MKRLFSAFLTFAFLALVLSTTGDARRTPALLQGVQIIPCATNITEVTDCPLTGCSDHEIDPLLNRRKNIRTSSVTPEFKLYSFLHNLPDPGDEYEEGGSRAPLTALGEGKMITVIAYAVRVSKGSKESCNCNLGTMRNKDNHIVLIDPNDRSPSKADEPNSQTAEFTPRVRLDHPDLKWSVLNALIEAARRKALKVRVTGLLMFDSHHFFNGALPRHNNWELHPVFKLEYCPRNNTCNQHSDANWTDIEE
jgi:hypothetical protein